jgi:hypothetical protein
MSEARKYFFFEKKKQKTLVSWLTRPMRATRIRSKKFFGSFFRKRTAFLRLPFLAVVWP